MLLTGRKLVSGSTFQTKVMDASSCGRHQLERAEPVASTRRATARSSTTRTSTRRTCSPDPGSGSASYKLYYAGNTLDASGNFHTRIGYATSSDGNSFGKVAGSQTGSSVLDVGAAATAFDARSASGLGVAAATGCDAGDGGLLRRRPRQRLQGAAGPRDVVRRGELEQGRPARRRDGSLLRAQRRRLRPERRARPWRALRRRTASGHATTGSCSSRPKARARRRSAARARRRTGRQKLPDTSAGPAARPGSSPARARASTPAAWRTPRSSSTDARSVRPLLRRDRRLGQPRRSGASAPAARRPVQRAHAGPERRRRRASFDAGGVKDPVVLKAGAATTGCSTRASSSSAAARRPSASATRRRRDGLSWTKRGVVLSPSRVPVRRPTRRASTRRVRSSTARSLRVFARGVDRVGPRARACADDARTPLRVSRGGACPNGDATYQLRRCDDQRPRLPAHRPRTSTRQRRRRCG